MKRTFEFGKIDFNGSGRKNCAVTVDVELTEKGDKKVFTASARVWNPKKTDIYWGGQILDDISKYIKDPVFAEIKRLWKKWHLNNMHSGTVAQEKALNEYFSSTNHLYDYTEACDYLKTIGLYEDTYNGEPYYYGHGWCYTPIDADDLDIIKKLIKEGTCD